MAKARVVNVEFNDEQIAFSDYRHRLLGEGDSWYSWAHLNLKPSSNILEQLEFRHPAVVVSLAYSGDVISNISDPYHNMALYFELQGLRYDAILLSGGGNDLIDALQPAGGPAIIVAGDGSNAQSYVSEAALRALTNNVLAGYRRIIAMRDASDANPETPIVLHAYDYPTPRPAPATFIGQPARGPWLLPAMQAAGVPETLYEDVTDVVFDGLADALLSLHAPQRGVHVVDTRGTLERAALNTTGLSGDWINEIHPDAHGYALLARKVAGELATLGIR
jgi:lysophospholipase L1-like esterase